MPPRKELILFPREILVFSSRINPMIASPSPQIIPQKYHRLAFQVRQSQQQRNAAADGALEKPFVFAQRLHLRKVCCQQQAPEKAEDLGGPDGGGDDSGGFQTVEDQTEGSDQYAEE